MTFPYFLTEGAKALYEYHLGRGRTCANYIIAWPEGVQFLLRSYARDSYILRALNEMDSLKQGQGETEADPSNRVWEHLNRCGSVFDGEDFIDRWSAGFNPILSPLLANLRAESGPGKTYHDYVECAE